MAKSWTEKLNQTKDLPKVVIVTEKMAGKWGTNFNDTVAIPSPKEVYDIMAKVPKKKLITTNEIRKMVAKKHKTTIGCPLTSGIFTWISANAAEEIAKNRKKPIIPYWRTLKSNGIINDKYPGGIDFQKSLLEKEGHKIVKKNNKYYVESYKKSLVKI